MKPLVNQKIITPIHDRLERYLSAEQQTVSCCAPWLFGNKSGHSDEKAAEAISSLQKQYAEVKESNKLSVESNEKRRAVKLLRPILNMLTRKVHQ